ncbi:MAG: hypothetical protein V4511_05245 [Bacteroidota bacterium]
MSSLKIKLLVVFRVAHTCLIELSIVCRGGLTGMTSKEPDEGKFSGQAIAHPSTGSG